MKNNNIIIGIIILMVLAAMPVMAKPTVIIIFDDGWRSVLDNAFPIMQGNNQKGVAFIITNQPDLTWNGLPDNYMNRSQLQQLYDAGWDLSSHTYSHKDLTVVNDTVLNFELRTSRDWLNTYFPRGATILAYPNGAYNQHVIDTLISNHYVAARTIVPDNNYPNYNLNSPNIFKLEGYATLDGPKGRPDNDITVINQINNTIPKNGTLILIFHKIVGNLSANTNNAKTEFLVSDFRNVSNYLYDRRSEVDVRTLSDYLGTMPLPRYTPPTPTNMSMIIGTNWINASWSSGIGYNTDIYNIYVNGVRINDSINPFINITTVPGELIGISVYAVNTTYGNFVNSTPIYLNDTNLVTNSTKSAPEFEIIVAIGVILAVYIMRKRR